MRIKVLSDIETYVYESEEKSTFTIGRSSEADFTIDESELSRKHCEITFKGHRVFIKDLASKNGVKVDGDKIVPNKLVEVFPETEIMLTKNLQLNLFGAETRTGLKLEAFIAPKPLVKYKKVKIKPE